MDITSLRAGQEVSPVGRSGSGSAGIGSAILSKDGASVVDRASINASISSGNRHIHGQGHHAANLSRLVKFMFSKKATKIDKIFPIDLMLCSKRQIDGEDFVNFRGLSRKYEL